MRIPLSLHAGCVILAGLACASPAMAGPSDWYGRGHGHPPSSDKAYICHGYTCRIVTPIRFSPQEFARIAGKLQRGAGDSADERQALAEAVQTFEVIVGARVGTSADLARMQFGQAAPDQMDCIDEATNTTSLLLMLADRGYLRHHRVEPPAARGFFLDGRYPHATAVLTDTASGEKWAIDSWPRANGEPPLVQPLAMWKRGRSEDLPGG